MLASMISLSLASTAAWAQSDAEVAARRQLIEEARRLSSAGDHARAVELATRASRIRTTPSLRAFLAAEQLSVGQVVRAMSNAEQCASELRRDTTASDRDRLIADCQRIAQQASERVARVTVEGLAESIAGLTVRVQGEPMNLALLGVPTVVDPGVVLVEVDAAGFRPFRQEIRVESRQSGSVRVELQREEAPRAEAPAPSDRNATSARAVSTQASAPVNVAPTPRPVAPRAQPERSLAGPIAVTVAGGAVLALSGLFVGLQVGAYGDCRIEGGENVCTGNTTIESAQTALTFNRVAIGAAIGGAALAVGGVTWLVLSRGASSERRAVAVLPSADASSAGVLVRGAF